MTVSDVAFVRHGGGVPIWTQTTLYIHRRAIAVQLPPYHSLHSLHTRHILHCHPRPLVRLVMQPSSSSRPESREHSGCLEAVNLALYPPWRCHYTYVMWVSNIRESAQPHISATVWKALFSMSTRQRSLLQASWNTYVCSSENITSTQ